VKRQFSRRSQRVQSRPVAFRCYGVHLVSSHHAGSGNLASRESHSGCALIGTNLDDLPRLPETLILGLITANQDTMSMRRLCYTVIIIHAWIVGSFCPTHSYSLGFFWVCCDYFPFSIRGACDDRQSWSRRDCRITTTPHLEDLLVLVLQAQRLRLWRTRLPICFAKPHIA
jgi:hypothetical protein